MKNLFSIVASLVVLAAVPFSARAAIIVYTPTGVSASSHLSVYPEVHSIDGSGLSGAVPPTINSTSDLPTHNAVPTNMWLTDDGNGPTATITFDLGSVVTIDTLYVWNSGEQSAGDVNRGAKNVNIDAGVASPSNFIQSFVFSEAPTFAMSPGVIPAVAYTLSSPITARYIKFDITSNWGNNDNPSYAGSAYPANGAPGTFGYVGLSEVRFGLAAESVPEPASLGVMALVALGGLTRRRR